MKHVFWILVSLPIQKTHSVGCARRDGWSRPLPHCAPRPMIFFFPYCYPSSLISSYFQSDFNCQKSDPFPPEHGTDFQSNMGHHFHSNMGLFLSLLLCRYSGFATLIRMAVKFKKSRGATTQIRYFFYISYYFLLGGFVTA